MPSSRYDLIPTVLDLITRIRPKSILDVGVGVGRWGVLFREFLDVWKTDQEYNWRNRKDATLLIGVEACEDYATPIWYAYDQVHINNVFDIMPKLPEVDLLFLGDVIEHFTKEDGIECLTKLKYKEAIILTPILVYPQEAIYGNKYEKHLSSWCIDDFTKLGLQPQIHATIDNQQLFHIIKE